MTSFLYIYIYHVTYSICIYIPCDLSHLHLGSKVNGRAVRILLECILVIEKKSRMHSSRMCTDRNSNHLGGGGSAHPLTRHPL